MVLLQDVLNDHERYISEQIDLKIAQHKQWNLGFVDMTKEPLTPPLETGSGLKFRTAITEYLPTPPASISSEHSGDALASLGGLNVDTSDSVAVRYASPSYDGSCKSQPSFRRRYGRGGRLWIDRRGERLPPKQMVSPSASDGFNFDDNDDDDDEAPVYFHDPFCAASMEFRAKIFPPQPSQAHVQQRRAQIEAQAANQNSTKSSHLPGPD